MDRYAIRRSGTGYGVWDAAMNGWHGDRDLTEPAAVELADKLNATINRTAERAGYRTVSPPRRVVVTVDGRAHPGVLDAWSRESDEWWGRVVIMSEAPRGWYPASVLRPG